MSRLRPLASRRLTEYPTTPIVYRRPVLRALSGAMLLGMTALGFVLVFMPPDDPTKRMTAADWYLEPLIFLFLGAGYLYVASSMSIDETHVQLRNPFRQVRIPLGCVRDVIEGSNLAIVTDHKTFYAWGVEAANFQIASGRWGTQTSLRGALLAVAGAAPSLDQPPPKYMLSCPDLLYLACLLATVGETVKVLTL